MTREKTVREPVSDEICVACEEQGRLDVPAVEIHLCIECLRAYREQGGQ